MADLRHLTRASIRAELARRPEGLEQLPGVHELHIEGLRLSCQVETGRIGALMSRLAEYDIRELISLPPSLEETFLRHYRDQATAADKEPAL